MLFSVLSCASRFERWDCSRLRVAQRLVFQVFWRSVSMCLLFVFLRCHSSDPLSANVTCECRTGTGFFVTQAWPRHLRRKLDHFFLKKNISKFRAWVACLRKDVEF